MHRFRTSSLITIPRGRFSGTLGLAAVAAFAIVALNQGGAPPDRAGGGGPAIWAVVRPTGYVADGGFARLMEALGREYRDCTEEFLGEDFSLDGCRVLILASFSAGDERVRARMGERAGKIARWARGGGVLLFGTQIYTG